MTWGPIGLWNVRLLGLGTHPELCRDGEITADVAVDGTLTVVDGTTRGPSLVGTWHRAGPGRVIVSIDGAWGLVEAAVELSEDGLSCLGRVLGRRRGPDGRTVGAASAADLEGRRARSTGWRDQDPADPLP